MEFCSDCGTQLNKETSFCFNCGIRIDKNSFKNLKNQSTNLTLLGKFLTYLYVVFAIDSIATALLIIIYENSYPKWVMGPNGSYRKYGPIEWGSGIVLILTISLIIAILQVVIYYYLFAQDLSFFTKINWILYLIIPIFHMIVLLLVLNLISEYHDIYYVMNALVSCELIIGIAHLYKRVTRYFSLSITDQYDTDKLKAQNLGIEDKRKEKERRANIDTKNVINYFEFIGGKKF